MAAAGVMEELREASEPPEARGLARDEVRLLVSDVGRGTIEHARFRDLPRWLSRGDLAVVNTSATLNAALAAASDTGTPFELHLSTLLPGALWTVELRQPGPVASLPYNGARRGLSLRLPAGGRATLLAPYPFNGDLDSPSRLWTAAVQTPAPLHEYLEREGVPIRYSYVPERWPGAAYQTMFAAESGSAEMPSAARPFTPDLVARLTARGVAIAPIVLHTGVASLEDHEPPYEERYRVPRDTAERVNAARRGGRRVVAVGTTVVRALETVTDDRGTTHPGAGWTDLVVTPERGLHAANALITGFHEPRASHLSMLEAIAGRSQLDRAYDEARRAGYLWHEFGDSHLILGALD